MRIIFFVFTLIILTFSQHGAAETTIPAANSQSAINPSQFAKIQGMLVSADSMDRDNEKDFIQLKGNVQIIYNQNYFFADEIHIYPRFKRLECIGNVKIQTLNNTIIGNYIALDYESNTGIIHNGFVQAGSVVFEGKIISKTGESEFFVQDASYTTCENCPATWAFNGSQIRAELGGYAYIKNSILKVGSVPILWLPYLIVPLNSNRQTGLLTPQFETSNISGFTYSQPIFWAINQSSDLTYTLRSYEFRGVKNLFNYRYVLDSQSLGELDFGTINDRVFRSDDRFNRFRSPQNSGRQFNRWFVRYDHYYVLPNDYINRTQLNLSSDLQYPVDFPTETKNYGDSALENRVSLTKNTEKKHISLDGDFYINTLRGDPTAANNNSVHRIPEFRYSMTTTEIPKLNAYFNFDFNYTNFTRNGKSYDDMTGVQTISDNQIRYVENNCGAEFENDPTCTLTEDGQFNPGQDLIRTGQRLDFRPSIYRPFRIANVFELTPKLSFRETHYNFQIDDKPLSIRRYMRTELGAKTNFSGIFGDVQNSLSTRFKHEVIPELTYTSIPWIDHRAHPFFGFGDQNEAQYFTTNTISDADLGSDYGLQFDYNDRIVDRNLLTFSVTNKLIQKKWQGDSPIYRQIGFLKLSQSYDAYQNSLSTSNKQPLSDLTAILEVRLDQFQTYSTFNYYPYQKVTNSSSRIRTTDDRGRFLQLGITNRFTIQPNQPVDTKTRIEDYTLAVGLTANRFNVMGQITYDANRNNTSQSQAIKSWSGIAQIKPPGNCWVINLSAKRKPDGEEVSNIDFQFNYDGSPSKALSMDDLEKLNL